MKYLLIMQINPDVMTSLSNDERQALHRGHEEFQQMAREAGEMISSHALADPSTSTVVRGRDGVPAVTDGPFVEAKEFMGAFYLVDVDSHERAVELAKLLPDARVDGLAIEIRPVMFSAGADL
jgi:hypothetical protein